MLVTTLVNTVTPVTPLPDLAADWHIARLVDALDVMFEQAAAAHTGERLTVMASRCGDWLSSPAGI